MVLYISHECWQGRASSFHKWRNEIAEYGGYQIVQKTRNTKYIDNFTFKQADIDYSIYVEKNYQGEWDKDPIDPLLILIVHSDSIGCIYPAHQIILANRLEEILSKIDPSEFLLISLTQRFISGLRLASTLKETVEFY